MLSRIAVASVVLGGLPLAVATCSPSAACPPASTSDAELGPAGHALQFCGTGEDDVDRVKVVVDDPTNSDPGPPADVGATDFTLEWWMRASPGRNRARAVECGRIQSPANNSLGVPEILGSDGLPF